MQQCTVDVIGIIFEVHESKMLNLKDGSQRAKRELLIGDETNISIMVTLWGDICEAQPYKAGQVIALKACRISDYNGKCLNASSDMQDIVLNLKH